MTRVTLLEQMKAFTGESVKDLLLPVPPPYVEDIAEDDQEDFFDEESDAAENVDEKWKGHPHRKLHHHRPPPLPQLRAANVFLTALPEKNSAVNEAPYILHQVIKSRDFQQPGEIPRSEIVLRSVFCVYHENGEEGGLALLGLMERLRLAMLRKGVVGKQFALDLTAGMETLIYSNTEPPPDGTAPFYLGEMITTWKCPIIEREVYYGKERYNNIKQPGPGRGCDQLCDGRFLGGIVPGPGDKS